VGEGGGAREGASGGDAGYAGAGGEPSSTAEECEAVDECRVGKGDEGSENLREMQETWRSSFSSMSLSHKSPASQQRLMAFQVTSAGGEVVVVGGADGGLEGERRLWGRPRVPQYEIWRRCSRKILPAAHLSCRGSCRIFPVSLSLSCGPAGDVAGQHPTNQLRPFTPMMFKPAKLVIYMYVS
jgi:hypothetical protein